MRIPYCERDVAAQRIRLNFTIVRLLPRLIPRFISSVTIAIVIEICLRLDAKVFVL